MSNLSPQQFGKYPEIRAGDLSTTDARRSREVSPGEFQQIAGRGEERYNQMRQQSAEPKGLDKHWDSVVDHAYNSTREEWGGTTVHSRTGKPMSTTGNKYALTAREPGMPAISVSPDATREEFGETMGHARAAYGEVLSRKGHHLGVFHDGDKKSVDIDPVVIVGNRKHVEEVGAYTRATGGGYHFKSGNGYWPPHVKD